MSGAPTPRRRHLLGRRRALTAVAALALLLPLAALAASRGGHASVAAAPAPDFAREVAPIVRETCAGCHTPGGIAPFAFRTAADLSSRAALVVAALESRRMPPWPPGPRSPAYTGQAGRTLSARERDTLVRWARVQRVRPGEARDRTPVGAAPTRETAPRAGETALSLGLPSAYGPRATGGGSDDYRCFLLDPGLSEDAFVTSARIEPGVASLVHHVILFRVPPASVAAAQALDRGAPGAGWSCFGGTGVPTQGGAGEAVRALDDAPWIAAWAPGFGGDRLPDGTGIPLPRGSRVVMQVHYNLLNGARPDRSHAVLTTVPASTGLTPVETTLLPAPVELPCPAGTKGRLCDRTASLADQVRKYGSGAGFVPVGLLLLCGKNAGQPPAGQVTSCDRTLDRPTTIRSVGGHMHLLGRSIRIELNPGTAQARTLLDIPRWDFHWQGLYVLAKPVQAGPGDVLRVTCRHDASLRAGLVTKAARAPRYTLWGEGTTDEMCLGLLQVTRGAGG